MRSYALLGLAACAFTLAASSRWYAGYLEIRSGWSEARALALKASPFGTTHAIALISKNRDLLLPSGGVADASYPIRKRQIEDIRSRFDSHSVALYVHTPGHHATIFRRGSELAVAGSRDLFRLPGGAGIVLDIIPLRGRALVYAPGFKDESGCRLLSVTRRWLEDVTLEVLIQQHPWFDELHPAKQIFWTGGQHFPAFEVWNFPATLCAGESPNCHCQKLER